MTMDRKAFHAMSYGLFLLTARHDGRDNGCIINTAIQSASDPKSLTVSCIKGSLTQEFIEKSGVFNVSVLTESTPMQLFKDFGMVSGRDVDKFPEPELVSRCSHGVAYDPEANAYFSCTVTSSQDLGSHVLYTGTVQEAKLLSDEPSITYARYHERKREEAQAQPVQETTGKVVGWRCTVCGYIYEGEELPQDYICPLCKHGAEDFEPVYDSAKQPGTQAEAVKTATIVGTQDKGEGPASQTKGTNIDKWVCKVCGYVYEGAEPPAECPVCHVGAEQFMKMSGEMKLAAEHEYGIYAKTVKNNDAISAEDKEYIREQLMANFTGECSEVGMYLCMARIAHREGYPEIGLYWEKAAYEEAEHAAKFAELLGEELEPNMKASTKENLAWRVDCEFGATQGKVDLATCAKKNNLDAIHDTVHEMARDEARHGKALKGLLERYFG